MARQCVELVQSLRSMDLRKSPSISETLDWAKALVALNAKSLDAHTLETTLSVLLKHESIWDAPSAACSAPTWVGAQTKATSRAGHGGRIREVTGDR
jgi:hypothetical protein